MQHPVQDSVPACRAAPLNPGVQMPTNRNIARRGDIYWWRKQVTLGQKCNVRLAFSLSTSDHRRARRMAGCLVAYVDEWLDPTVQAIAIGEEQRKQVFVAAFRRHLDRLKEAQTYDPGAPGEDATLNPFWCEFYSILARGGWTIEEDRRLLTAGWTEQERAVLAEQVIAVGRDRCVVGMRQIEDYADAYGFVATSGNVARTRHIIYRARAEAIAAASQPGSGTFTTNVGPWIAEAVATPEVSAPTHAAVIVSNAHHHDDDATLPPNCQGPTPVAVPAATAATVQPTTKAETSVPVGQGNGEAPDRPLSFAAAVDACIEANRSRSNDTKGWAATSCAQVRTAARLFAHIVGNPNMRNMTQRDVGKLVQLFDALPNRWGRTAKEATGGIAASLERAADLTPEMLGLSPATRNKHLTWLAAVVKYAASHGHGPATKLEFTELRASDVGDLRIANSQKRADWTTGEIARLLAAPVWTGSANIDNRFEPGKMVVHDGTYFAPLMLVLYGARSAEVVGLDLANIHEDGSADEPIPRFRLADTKFRRLKTISSTRTLPIHPELIRLGFVEYIRAVRERGEELLFPDFLTVNSKSFSSTFYKKVF